MALGFFSGLSPRYGANLHRRGGADDSLRLTGGSVQWDYRAQPHNLSPPANRT